MKMRREEIKKRIMKLEAELECLEKKLDESVVKLKLKNGKVMEILEGKIVKLSEGSAIKGEDHEGVAWVSETTNLGLVIHFDSKFNYHLGRDAYGLILVVTKKHDC